MGFVLGEAEKGSLPPFISIQLSLLIILRIISTLRRKLRVLFCLGSKHPFSSLTYYSSALKKHIYLGFWVKRTVGSSRNNLFQVKQRRNLDACEQYEGIACLESIRTSFPLISISTVETTCFLWDSPESPIWLKAVLAFHWTLFLCCD